MPVRAKFKCTSKTESTNGFKILMEPVTGGSPENAKFYQYTPGGSLVLDTVNSHAASQFKVGQEYYLDFELALPS